MSDKTIKLVPKAGPKQAQHEECVELMRRTEKEMQEEGDVIGVGIVWFTSDGGTRFNSTALDRAFAIGVCEIVKHSLLEE